MSLVPPPTPPGPIVYPDSDGKPMADNTLQFRWIQTLEGNLEALYRDRPDVFVAGDLLIYPVEGQPDVNTAPDVLVVFGRPKGDRGSYKYWEEGDVPLTVAFEVLSPSNTIKEMADKLAFYDEYGVEEYYVYDPYKNQLEVYRRKGTVLRRVRGAKALESPRLKIRFDLSGPEMVVYNPDGSPFRTFKDEVAERTRAEQRAQDAQRQAEQALQRADHAEQRADHAEQQADQARQRADRMAELISKVMEQQASPEELQELQRLLREASTDR